MAADLIPSPDRLQPHRLRLPAPAGAATALEEVGYALGTTRLRGSLWLEADEWLLRVAELRELGHRLASRGLRFEGVRSQRRETLVAASALGLAAEWPPDAGALPSPGEDDPATAAKGDGLLIHSGTLRSGDHLRAEGSVLLLGDVNPGAQISADRHVLVWGRLRGIAHAGRQGDRRARIVALQLRPLQLRIADAVARGPQEAVPEGLAEEARLVGDEIRIDPAPPCWPLAERERPDLSAAPAAAATPVEGPNLPPRPWTP